MRCCVNLTCLIALTVPQSVSSGRRKYFALQSNYLLSASYSSVICEQWRTTMKMSRIKDEAARRLIELETATGGRREACRANLNRWFNEDPQHRAAFDSMEQAWKAVDDLKIFVPGAVGAQNWRSLPERKVKVPRGLYGVLVAPLSAFARFAKYLWGRLVKLNGG